MAIKWIKRPVELKELGSASDHKDYCNMNAVENNIIFIARRIDVNVVNYSPLILQDGVYDFDITFGTTFTNVNVGDYVNIFSDQYSFFDGAYQVISFPGANTVRLNIGKNINVPPGTVFFMNFRQNWRLEFKTLIYPNRANSTASIELSENILTCDKRGFIYVNIAPFVRNYIDFIKDDFPNASMFRWSTVNLMPFNLIWREVYKGSSNFFNTLYTLPSVVSDYSDWGGCAVLSGLSNGSKYDSVMYNETFFNNMDNDLVPFKNLTKMKNRYFHCLTIPGGLLPLPQAESRLCMLADVMQMSFYYAYLDSAKNNIYDSTSVPGTYPQNNTFMEIRALPISYFITNDVKFIETEIEINDVIIDRQIFEIKTACLSDFEEDKASLIRWINTNGAYEYWIFKNFKRFFEKSSENTYRDFSPFLSNTSVEKDLNVQRSETITIYDRIKTEDAPAFVDLITSPLVQKFTETIDGIAQWKEIKVLSNSFTYPIRMGEEMEFSIDVKIKENNPQNW